MLRVLRAVGASQAGVESPGEPPGRGPLAAPQAPPAHVQGGHHSDILTGHRATLGPQFGLLY